MKKRIYLILFVLIVLAILFFVFYKMRINPVKQSFDAPVSGSEVNLNE